MTHLRFQKFHFDSLGESEFWFLGHFSPWQKISWISTLYILITYLVLMVDFLIHVSYVRWRKGHGCCGRRNRRRQVKAGLIRVVPIFRSTAASCVAAISAGIFGWKNRIRTKLSGKHGMGLKIFITCLMTRWGSWRCLIESWKVLAHETLLRTLQCHQK